MHPHNSQSQGVDSENPRDEALVPWQAPQLPSNDVLYEFFEAGDVARRESAHDLLHDLLVVSGASSVTVREAINPDKVYRLVKGGITEVPGSGGNIRGVEWRCGLDGKGMRKFAEFKQVGNAVKLASTFFSQGMLIYIACELNDIKKGIVEIQDELFESEVSKMKGLIDSAGRTLRLYRRNRDTDLLNNAIQPLGAEIVPLLEAIVRRVRRLPSETSLFGPSASTVKANYDKVMSAIIWLLKGMVALCLLYSVHDPEFGKAEMINLLDKFREAKELGEWLAKVGRTLAMKDYGEKYYDDVVRMEKTLLCQHKVLSASNVGISLSGRQLLELQDQSTVSSVECGVRQRERVRP